MASLSARTGQLLSWDSCFQLFADPVVWLKRTSEQQWLPIRINTSYQQLILPFVEHACAALPQSLTNELNEMLQAADATARPWQLFSDTVECAYYRLQLFPLEQSQYILVMTNLTLMQSYISDLEQQAVELQQRLLDIERLKNRIKEQAIRDPLTNLFNRRFLNEFMEREMALARRNQKPLAVVMLDLDHFKQLNDQYGHQTGDVVIEMVAKNLLRQSRRTDVLFRYGGEEFLVILPNTTSEQAHHLAENWRVQIEAGEVFAKHQVIHVTISAGIACYPEHGTTAFNLIEAADEALYQAKAAGRNQVMMC